MNNGYRLQQDHDTVPERCVWKYRLDPHDTPDQPFIAIRVPTTAILRKAGIQRGYVCLWFEVADREPLVSRLFAISATGASVPKDGVYVDSVFQPDVTGSPAGFVWHIYEIPYG